MMLPLTVGDFDHAPFHFTVSGLLSAPSAAVFAELADPSPWFPLMSRSAWHGRAGGVGAEREVSVRLFGAFKETMLVWEPHARIVFTMTATSSPLVDRMGEEFKVTPELGGSRLDWTVVLHPTRVGRVAAPALRKILARMFTFYRPRLERRAAAPTHDHGTHAS
jgi:hypothetical protein